MRTLLHTIINTLLSAEADAVCGAEYGTPSPDRTNSRNGYRARELDTRVGTIDVQIPKLRQGSYFPDWLLERRKRSESAMITVRRPLAPTEFRVTQDPRSPAVPLQHQRGSERRINTPHGRAHIAARSRPGVHGWKTRSMDDLGRQWAL